MPSVVRLTAPSALRMRDFCLEWVMQTVRFLFLKIFGAGKWMQTTAANVGFICTASSASHKSWHIFNPHIVTFPVFFDQKQIHVMCALYGLY